MAEVMSCNELDLLLIASGTHFSEPHGSTWREIISDGFCIDARVDKILRTKKYWPEIAVLTNVKQLPELTGLKSKTKFLVSEKLLFNIL
jgi:hypothetical protein